MRKRLLKLAVGAAGCSLLAPAVFAGDAPSVVALPDAHDAQVAAATDNARAALRLQVLEHAITPSLTVEDLLEHTRKTAPFEVAIDHAQQVGGIRWLDDQTCQVRLSLNGSDVAAVLEKIASDRTTHVPRTAGEFRRALGQFDDVSFSADGTSMAPALAARLSPQSQQGPWSNVTDRDRQAALSGARDNAVDHILQSIGAISLPHGRKLSEAMADRHVSAPLTAWLASRPISAVEFGDDLEVRLTLAVPPEQLWAVLHPALAAQTRVPMPTTSAGWQTLASAVQLHVGPGVGRSYAVAAAPAQPAVSLPAEPPAWTNTTLDAVGEASSRGSKLHTARVAEQVALTHLRTRIESLQLAPQRTLAQAAKADPHIAKAIDRAIDAAQTAQVDYDTPGVGSVRAHVQLPLSLLWRELTGE